MKAEILNPLQVDIVLSLDATDFSILRNIVAIDGCGGDTPKVVMARRDVERTSVDKVERFVRDLILTLKETISQAKFYSLD